MNLTLDRVAIIVDDKLSRKFSFPEFIFYADEIHSASYAPLVLATGAMSLDLSFRVGRGKEIQPLVF